MEIRQLQPGDRVVLQTGPVRSPGHRLATVARVTPTQIILDRPGRDRFSRNNGRLLGVGRAYGMPFIVGLATPAQIRTIEAAERAEAARARQHQDRQEAIRTENRLLGELFPAAFAASVQQGEGRFEVTLICASAVQVRALAGKLNQP